MGNKFIGIPAQIIGKAINDVFYQRIASAARGEQNLSDHITRATVVLSLSGIVPLLLAFFLSPIIFIILFGEEWAKAGEYARWLSFFFYFNFVNKPCVASIPVLGLQKGLLIFEVLSGIAKAISLIIGFYVFKDDVWTLALFSLTGSICYVLLIVGVIKLAANTR